MNGREKSDPVIVAVMPPNEAGRPAEEAVERRAGAEGNASQHSTHRAQDRASVTQGLERVRQAARQRRQERFTALLHHVTPDSLRTAFYALKRDAAPGADGVTWRDYEAELEPRLAALHERVHRGAYRRNRRVGSTSRRRTESSGRWRLPPWRTRSSRAPRSWCPTPSTRKNSSGFRMGSGPDAHPMMRWMPWSWGSLVQR